MVVLGEVPPQKAPRHFPTFSDCRIMSEISRKMSKRVGKFDNFQNSPTFFPTFSDIFQHNLTFSDIIRHFPTRSHIFRLVSDIIRQSENVGEPSGEGPP